MPRALGSPRDENRRRRRHPRSALAAALAAQSSGIRTYANPIDVDYRRDASPKQRVMRFCALLR